MAEATAAAGSEGKRRASSSTRAVGRYELGKTIGEGSFAKVKIARDTRSGAACAIKVLDRNHVLRHKMVEQVAPAALSLLRPTSTSQLIDPYNSVCPGRWARPSGIIGLDWETHKFMTQRMRLH